MKPLLKVLKRHRLSVRAKMGYIALISILPSLFIVWISAQNLRRANTKIWQGEIIRTTEAIAGQIGLIIRSTEQVLETIAASNSIKKMELDRIHEYMENLVSRKNEYATIILVDTDKQVIAAGIPVSNYSLADRAYLQEAIERNEFIIGPYTISRSTGIPIIPMAWPVKDDTGETKAILIASLRIDSIAASLTLPGLEPGSILEVIDPAGIRIWRYPESPDHLPGHFIPTEFFLFGKTADSKNHALTRWKDSKYHFVSRKVHIHGAKDTGITVILASRQSGLFGTNMSPLAIYLGLGLLAISISFLLSSLMYRRYIGLRLARLTKEAARLGMQGHIGLKSRQRGEDEIDLIARTLHESGIAIRQRNRQNEESSKRIALSLKEKETLLKEIHHRVKNNFQVISSLLSLQAMSIKDSSVHRIFDESRNRIQSMALIHEQLYRSDTYAWIDFAEYAQSLAQQIALSWYDRAGSIQVNVEGKSCPLPLDYAVPLALALNELISNGFKHGFKQDESGDIRVILRSGSSGECNARMIVSDSGAGLPQGFSLKENANLGLELVNTLCQQLKGSLDIQSPLPDLGRGCAFILCFPLPESFSWE